MKILVDIDEFDYRIISEDNASPTASHTRRVLKAIKEGAILKNGTNEDALKAIYPDIEKHSIGTMVGFYCQGKLMLGMDDYFCNSAYLYDAEDENNEG